MLSFFINDDRLNLISIEKTMIKQLSNQYKKDFDNIYQFIEQAKSKALSQVNKVVTIQHILPARA